MAYHHGTFVWRELITNDAAEAEKFYASVFGWKISSVPFNGGTYRLVDVGGKQIAGIFDMPTQRGVPTHWNPYVSVNDVDALAELAKSHGAKILIGPSDIPSVGRYAAVMPPAGGAFTLFKSLKGDTDRDRPKLGEFCWEQLNSSNVKAEMDFYGPLLGWKTEPFKETGLVIFSGPDGGVASMLPTPRGIPSHWLSHIAVEKLAAARARITEAGGKVLLEQMEVPELGAFAVAQDPEGATFCVFESIANTG